jgi:hypothetical protein
MKKKWRCKSVLIFVFYFTILFCSCKPATKLSAKEIVEKSVEFHGGMELWKNSKSLSFDKKIILYTKEGVIESEQTQHQKFEYDQGFSGKLKWVKNGDSISVGYRKEKAFKKINNAVVVLEKELQSAKKTFFSAHYVVNQPFKLLEDAVVLSYITTKIIDGRSTYVIQVGYTNDTEISDKWFYYFETKTYQLVATKVVHGARISMIKNVSYDKSTGLLFNHHRKSFFIKPSGEMDYLRAEYFYTNFYIK